MYLHQALAYLRQYEDADRSMPGRYLFRGQARDFGSIKPRLARDEQLPGRGDWAACRGQAFTVSLYAERIAKGLRGLIPGLKAADCLLLLEHYGWVSHAVGVTGTLDVAVFFARLGWSAKEEAVIYVFDAERMSSPGRMVTVGHEFVQAARGPGPTAYRFSRQDCHAVAAAKKYSAVEALKVDLQDSPGLVDSVHFRFGPGEGPLRTDYLDMAADPVAGQLGALVRVLADEFYGCWLSPRLASVVEYMCANTPGAGQLSPAVVRDDLGRHRDMYCVDFLRKGIHTLLRLHRLDAGEAQRLFYVVDGIEERMLCEAAGVSNDIGTALDGLMSCGKDKELFERMLSYFHVEVFRQGRVKGV